MRRPSFLVLTTVALAAAVFGYACGGSSSSDYTAKCKQVCEKEKSCHPDDPTYAAINCDTFCTATVGGTGGSSGQTCKNEAAAIAKFDQCLTMECSVLEACFEQAGALCDDGSATGGTSGGTGGASGATGGKSGSTGGASGATGGASGGGDCNTICNKVFTCCTAAGLGDACTSQQGGTDIATACASAAAASLATSCQQYLSILAASYPTVGACK